MFGDPATLRNSIIQYLSSSSSHIRIAKDTVPDHESSAPFDRPHAHAGRQQARQREPRRPLHSPFASLPLTPPRLPLYRLVRTDKGPPPRTQHAPERKDRVGVHAMPCRRKCGWTLLPQRVRLLFLFLRSSPPQYVRTACLGMNYCRTAITKLHALLS
jgi:hypothetical protein